MISMNKLGAICTLVSVGSFVLGIAVMFFNWIIGGALIAVSIGAFLLTITWDVAEFATNTTDKLWKWSKDEIKQ